MGTRGEIAFEESAEEDDGEFPLARLIDIQDMDSVAGAVAVSERGEGDDFAGGAPEGGGGERHRGKKLRGLFEGGDESARAGGAVAPEEEILGGERSVGRRIEDEGNGEAQRAEHSAGRAAERKSSSRRAARVEPMRGSGLSCSSEVRPAAGRRSRAAASKAGHAAEAEAREAGWRRASRVAA